MSEELKLASEVKEEELTEIEEKPKKKKATKKEEKEPQLLDLPGVGAGTVSKLEEAGVYDIMGVAAMTPNMLAEKSGMSVAVSRKVIQAAYKLSNMDFITATEQKGKDKELRYISFGCKNLDGLIGGYGIRTKSITEAFGHFGSGKCMSKDTKVLVDNKLVEIQSLWNKTSTPFEEGEVCNINNMVYSVDEFNNVIKSSATKIWREKVKNLLEIKTRSGRVLKITGSHKLPIFRNKMDWEDASNLCVGERIRIPFFDAEDKRDDITPADAYFIGLYVAEGSSNPWSISNGDDRIRDWIISYIEKYDKYTPTVTYRNNCHRILIRKLTIDRLLKEFKGLKAGDKFIPDSVFLGDIYIKESFFYGYFDGDGSVNGMEMTTKSEKLASQLTYIINSLKINTKTSDKFIKGYGNYKRITMHGENINNLHMIGLNRSLQPGSFCIQKNIVESMSKHYKSLGKIKTFGKKDKIVSSLINNHFNRNAGSIGYTTFNAYLDWLENIDTDFYNRIKDVNKYDWDEIISIKEVKYYDYVYDLVVPDYQNFIGGDIPTLFHNSQISMSLAVQAQLPDENGKIGKVVYIDTEGSFRTDRIEQFAKGAGLDPDKVLDNIMVARAFNSNHQILLMDKVKELLKNKEPIKLIIVDSLTAHFRTEYDGRGQLAPRQQTLNKYIKDIQKIADLYNIAVYVTNQVMSDPAQMFGDPTKPVGGNIVGHACLASDTIVLAKDGFKELRDVEVGDYIWGRDRFVKVYDKMEKKVKKCKEIRSNNFITASEEHKFPLHTSEGIKDEIVEDIYVGDVFISPEKINVENKDIKLNIKPKRLARLTPVIAGVIKQSLSGRFKDNKELELLTGITIRQLRRVINELYPTNMSVLEGLIEYTLKRDIADMDYILIETKKHRNIEIPEYLDEKIGRLYGAWLCDGSKTESRSFKITKHEKDYLEKLNILVEESFGISGRITKVKDKDAWRLVVNSVEIVNVFNSININELINIEDDILIKFLASLIDGDGSFSNGNMTFSQKNSKLVTKIQMMLYRFSIKSAINRDKDGIYSLSIYAFNRKKLEDNLINHEKYKHPTPSKRNREQINNHSIKSMEEVGEKEVYDISVDGEYFLANGVITHNSAYRIYLRRGAKDSRIAKLVDAPEFEDSATAFNVEENGLEDIKV